MGSLFSIIFKNVEKVKLQKGLDTCLFALLIFFFLACTRVNKIPAGDFRLVDAFYYSWMADQNHMGFDLEIHFQEVSQGVNIDSVIFRGFQVPLWKDKNHSNIYKAHIETGTGRILNSGQKATDKPDQILFTKDGTSHSLPLPKLRREKRKDFSTNPTGKS